MASCRADLPFLAATEDAVANELLVALALPVVVHPTAALHVKSDQAQPRHTTRTGRPPSGAAIAAVGTHCATIWYMPPPGPACIITGHIPQAWPCIVPIGGAPACTVTPACTVPGTPACAGDIACCSTPPCPGCNCLGEVARMGAAGAPPPWRCGSTAAVLGLARTTVVAVGGLAEAGLASSGCPSSESGERARLLASPFSEVIVATGRTMTAERMALPESSAESVLGETALTGSDPVERPIGNWSLSVLLVHAFTGSDEAGAEPVGLAAAVFAGVVSEDGAAWYSSMHSSARGYTCGHGPPDFFDARSVLRVRVRIFFSSFLLLRPISYLLFSNRSITPAIPRG